MGMSWTRTLLEFFESSGICTPVRAVAAYWQCARKKQHGQCRIAHAAVMVEQFQYRIQSQTTLLPWGRESSVIGRRKSGVIA
jgi:hypothetical protein